jgi:hypothetical protein
MTNGNPTPEDLGQLAREAMEDKRQEVGNETQARELWDIPSESDAALAEQQEEEE